MANQRTTVAPPLLLLLIPLVVVMVTVTVATPAGPEQRGDPHLQPHWEAWKSRYGKAYDEAEEGQRRLVWEHNLKMIDRHNLEEALGKHSYTLAMNQYGDMSEEEFQLQMAAMEPLADDDDDASEEDNEVKKWTESFINAPLDVSLPNEIDWRNRDVVTPVKNQKKPRNCWASWAFSATGAMESHWKIKRSGELLELSEQQLIDCSRPYGARGCRKGSASMGFVAVQQMQGINTEESYPYEGRDNIACRFNISQRSPVRVSGYKRIPSGSEAHLQAALATEGPVAVAIDARHIKIFYSSGIYYSRFCRKKANRLHHSMLAVGYGTEDGKDFWLLKNSWGAGWGEQGYMRLARNRNNNCGVASDATYPIV
uniref:Cathepsin L1-like isoform X2 n=1 Tax=Petromyzon marinus TaxID=7757 RepID=A0AAJ7U8F7_PETMA|nr:cathepsin L1-like isoform X2 [Petromyzon marinus]